MSLFEVHEIRAYPPLLLKAPEYLESGCIHLTYLVLFSSHVPPVQITLQVNPLSKDIEVEMVKRSREGTTLEDTWQHAVQQSPVADWMPIAPTGASPVLLGGWPPREIVPLADGVQYRCYLLLQRSLPPLQLTVHARGEEVAAAAFWTPLAQTWQEGFARLAQQEGAHLLEQPESGTNIYWLPLHGRFDVEGCAFGEPTYATVVKPLGADSLLILNGATGDDQEIVPTYLCYKIDDAWCRGEPDFSWEQAAEGTLARIVWQRQAFERLYAGVDLGSVARDGRDAYFQHVKDFQQQVLSDWHSRPSRFVASGTEDF